MTTSTNVTRRFMRFNLRFVFFSILVLALPLAWIGKELSARQQERAAEAKIRASGGWTDASRFAPHESAPWWKQLEYRCFGPRVEKLTIGWNANINSSVLTAFTELRYFRVTPSKDFHDLSPFMRMSNLDTLAVEETRVSDLRPLASLSKLRALYLRGTPVNDLSPLRDLHSLRQLWMDDTEVSDLGPISGLVGLTVLEFPRTRVTSLEAVRSMKALESINFEGTGIQDLSPLSELKHLEFVTSNEQAVNH